MSKPAGRRRRDDLSRTLAQALSFLTLCLTGMVFGAAGAGVYDLPLPEGSCVGSMVGYGTRPPIGGHVEKPDGPVETARG